MRSITHSVDLCVVGGGLSGMCAAISAARHGVSVALVHDRPVLGGNASSEIRVPVCGAQGKNHRETGILEEIMLENSYRNPLSNYSIWDSILYEKVRFEPNITLLLNCTCNDIDMDGTHIRAVKAWQLTTETQYRIEASLFADCSGDSILAPLSGADFRIGREAWDEFDEDAAPKESDSHTQGSSVLINAREMTTPQTFIPPTWAYSYPTEEALPKRFHNIRMDYFWWIDIGGDRDTINDAEDLRDELLKIAFGVWDHVKNHCTEFDAGNLVLDWIGFLPGKRESRRYLGDHVLTMNDVRAEGRFDDLIAYGGFPMDEHDSAGFHNRELGTIYHPTPSPYGIPYRCLYSRNIDNLFCAGRNISATHLAASSSRVMATGSTMGQAVGIAASIAVSHGLTPRGIHENHVPELQQTLMDDDCYLPGNVRGVPALTRNARLSASENDPAPLRNGHDRPDGETDNGFTIAPGGWMEYTFDRPEKISRARIVFDSDLNRGITEHLKHFHYDLLDMRCYYPLIQKQRAVPQSLVKAFRIDTCGGDGVWRTVFSESNNHQRLVVVPLDVEATAVRLVPEETWGTGNAHVFSWDLT
jgi:hypothetical protein